jgi:hypothetical protein
MLIVGSKALKHHYPTFPRSVNDIDLIGFKKDAQILIKLLDPLTIKETQHTILLKNISNKTHVYDTDNVEILLADNSESLKSYLEYDKDNIYASKEVLYSLKKSHIHFPIKFRKHIHDYCFLNEELDGFDKLESITKINYKETELRVGKLKTPSLNVSVDEFFGQSKDYVKPLFVHDDVHRVMAHYDKPLYEKMVVEKTNAFCDKDIWRIFPFEDKCKCVLEEAYVIALERKILPMLFRGGKFFLSDEAFDWALMRICTNLTSGWFREFATNNYFIIKMLYKKNYVEKFLTEYENGNITRQTSN